LKKVNLILDKKLKESLKLKKDDKSLHEDENIKFEPKNFSWKEESINDDYKYYKKSKFNKYNKYNYKNKRHFKDNKFNKKNKIIFIEKEIEFDTKEKNEVCSQDKASKSKEENKFTCDSDKDFTQSSEKNADSNFSFNSQENTEEISSLEFSNLNLMKSQSGNLPYESTLNYRDIGFKLFPGFFHLEKKKSFDKNSDNFIFNKMGDKDKNFECKNYLCKSNYNLKKKEQKIGLELAEDYYSSFLKSQIIL
jgi:hypothetical protein